MPNDLEILGALTGLDWGAEGSDGNEFFDPIGLILHLPRKRREYWCTPTNSVSFASTGGDGTHFGVLRVGSLALDHSPVVMTVPMSNSPNWIVGADLREFLAPGCRRGYFALEHLAYDLDETASEYSSSAYDEEASEVQIEKLRLIEATFELEPWQRVRPRLDELQSRFRGLLEVPRAEAD
jgi:hypothetical protein